MFRVVEFIRECVWCIVYRILAQNQLWTNECRDSGWNERVQATNFEAIDGQKERPGVVCCRCQQTHQLRLGLHIAIFLQVSADDSAANGNFFLHHVHGAIFSAHLCWSFGGWGKLSFSRSIFLTEFCSPVRNVDAALSDPGCSTPNIYTRHCDFMWKSYPFSAKMYGEKIAVEHMDTAPFVSTRSASSMESSADTCGKESQHVALAWYEKCLARYGNYVEK